MVDNEYMYMYIKASNENLELKEENKRLKEESLKQKNEIARLNLELGKLQGKQEFLLDDKENNMGHDLDDEELRATRDDFFKKGMNPKIELKSEKMTIMIDKNKFDEIKSGERTTICKRVSPYWSNRIKKGFMTDVDAEAYDIIGHKSVLRLDIIFKNQNQEIKCKCDIYNNLGKYIFKILKEGEY